LACKGRNFAFDCKLLDYSRIKQWTDGELGLKDNKRLRSKYIWIGFDFEPSFDWTTMLVIQEWEQRKNLINGNGQFSSLSWSF
jgi:hypothetical protein